MRAPSFILNPDITIKIHVSKKMLKIKNHHINGACLNNHVLRPPSKDHAR